jgi:hypothetical protein
LLRITDPVRTRTPYSNTERPNRSVLVSEGS